jgi:hypothetical protein
MNGKPFLKKRFSEPFLKTFNKKFKKKNFEDLSENLF